MAAGPSTSTTSASTGSADWTWAFPGRARAKTRKRSSRLAERIVSRFTASRSGRFGWSAGSSRRATALNPRITLSELPSSWANPAAMPPSVASRSARSTSRVFCSTRSSSEAMSRSFSWRRSSSRSDMRFTAFTRSASSRSGGTGSCTPVSSPRRSAASTTCSSGRAMRTRK